MKVVMIMNKAKIRNILNIVKFNLKVNKNNILGWTISIFMIMFIYMILFPTIKDIATVKMELMPEGMLKLVGLNSLSDMNNYISYFGMIFNIILVAISIYAATFSAKLITKEESTKSIEFLNALNVSRSEIYLAKLLTAFISVTLVLLGCFSATLISGFISGGSTFVLYDFIKIIKISSISAYLYLALAFLISGITAKINVASISSFGVLFCYMMGYLGVLLNKTWLMYFSPFETFNANHALALSNSTFIALAVYFILMIIFIFIGHYFYKKRDFNI